MGAGHGFGTHHNFFTKKLVFFARMRKIESIRDEENRPDVFCGLVLALDTVWCDEKYL